MRELVQNVLKEKKLSNNELSKNELSKYDLYNNIHKIFSEQDTWAWENGNILCEIVLEDISEVLWAGSKPIFHEEHSELRLTSLHDSFNNATCLSVKYDDTNYLLKQFENKPKVFSSRTKSYEQPKEGIGYPLDTYKYWTAFIDSLVFIDPIRHFDRETSPNKECDFDGSSIIKDIIKLRNEQDAEWLVYKDKIQEWIKVILSEPFLEIDPTDSSIRFYIKRGNKKIAANLNQLGTGVSQLFMLLSYLYINREKNLNVFIEEPECNLHPDAVVQLVNIIKSNFLKHRFFISTHSSALIDQVDNNWSVNQVIRKENNASIIQPCDNIVRKYDLLDELGIHASQLLQSNFIIWVEGPSDRIYLNKWIYDLSNKTLIEGKNYSFLMYGGANLTSYSIGDNEKFINILSTSRSCAVVCDSDKKDETSQLKNRVKLLQERLDNLEKETRGSDLNIKNYVHLWITEGREIENYIPHEILVDVLSKDEIKKKYFTEEGNQKKLIIDVNSLPNTKFSIFDSFDCFYSQMYVFEDGNKLNDAQKKKIQSHYTNKKVEIAKEVVLKWKPEYYDKLNTQIEKLIDIIRNANGYSSNAI
ncbi:ATP-dependent nuclease [Clostridium botulinum]|uniref:ATP-dependent nuclease n=1 Tax=Clostridium botulinum TaxID=1491 RepID=UPI0030028BB5